MDKWLDGLGYHRIPQNHLKPWNHILKFLYFDKLTGTVPLCNSWIFLVDRKKKQALLVTPIMKSLNLPTE